MTNSEHLEEILHDAHKLGIYDAVTTLSRELRETNPKLDLYEWNEFIQLTECLSEAWTILNHHFPTPETLSFDALKLKTQTIAKDDLGKALNKFASTVDRSNTRSEHLEYATLNLRKVYTAYIGSIVNDPLLQYS